MLFAIRQDLEKRVQECLTELFGEKITDYRVGLQVPAKIEFGDFSLTFPFELARVLREAPAKTANRFLEAFPRPDYISRIEIAGGGYINLFLDRPRIYGQALEALAGGSIWPSFATQPEKVIVEHTNINPNKAAHIGHLRNAVLGDCLVRLMRFNGYPVEVQNYIDNTGVQVADVVVGFLYLENKSLAEIMAIEERFDYYCWDLYARVATFYDGSEENQALRGQVLQGIEDPGSEIAEVADYVATRIVNCHLDTMERLGVYYDLLPRESDILHLKFWESAFEQLRDSGAITFETDGPNQGCWVMKYDKDGTEDVKIIVRSNGTVTYTGKDIAYQLWKLGKLERSFHYEPFRAYDDDQVVWATTSEPGEETSLTVPDFGHGDWVFNVIDVRQSYTQNVVYEGVRRLGFTEAAEHSVHFAYEMVALSPRCAQELGFELSEEEKSRAHVEVSGRRGLGVKADDLLDVLEERALVEVTARNEELDEEQRRDIARDIAIGALRYFMVKFTRNSLIVFDFEDAMSFEGETGPYLQYSAVRARNIIRKYHERYDVDTPALESVWRRMASGGPEGVPDDVWELITHLLKLRDMARSCLGMQEIATFARGLYGLSQRFSNFYNRHRIIGEDDETLRHILLAVVYIYYEGMQTGLDVLGIPVPERM